MVESGNATKAPGLVCTFYSYKGGVGRSMALANVGVLMASEGFRVLLVDWDLEAPGLEQYFAGAAHLSGDPSKSTGVVDLLNGQVEGKPLSWRDGLLKADFFGHSLEILSAGRRDDDYQRRLQALDWATMFREHRIGNYINELREAWRASYDFVLVDSRTGITDIGDVCTVILPDILVFLFTTNHQSVEGTRRMMARAVNARSKMPVNRNKLLGIPVPSRDERDKEYDKSIEWQQIFASEFGDLYREWLPKEVTPIDALNRLFIPYVASWSFGEHIPVLESERERADPTSLGAAYARLATLLSNRLDWSALEAGATAAEVVGTRVELFKAREEVLDAEIRRTEAEMRLREELDRLEFERLEAEQRAIEAKSRLERQSHEAERQRKYHLRTILAGAFFTVTMLAIGITISFKQQEKRASQLEEQRKVQLEEQRQLVAQLEEQRKVELEERSNLIGQMQAQLERTVQEQKRSDALREEFQERDRRQQMQIEDLLQSLKNLQLRSNSKTR